MGTRKRLAAVAVTALVTTLAPACRGTVQQDLDPTARSLIGIVQTFRGTLDIFWAKEFALLDSGPYHPPAEVVPYLRGTVPDVGCGISHDPHQKWARNAVYCPQDETVSFEVEFLEEEGRQFGVLASLLVIAHEWGHHLQHLDGQSSDPRAHSIQLELGADCYAGVFAEHVDKLEPFWALAIGDGAGTFQTAGAAVYLSGTTYQRWFDPGVHGTPRERALAFQVGAVTGDPQLCRDYAGYAPTRTRDIGGYQFDLPPGVEVGGEIPGEGISVIRGDLAAQLSSVSVTGGVSAQKQIGEALKEWFGDLPWRSYGSVQDTGPDAIFGGNRAVQPYSLGEPNQSYGAVLLHVSDTQEALLVDVRTEGSLQTADANALDPIAVFLYFILLHVCPPGSLDVICTDPNGLRPESP